MKTLTITCLMLATLVLTSLYGQRQLNIPKLDSLVSTLDVNQRAMFSFSIAEKGKVIYHGSVGYIDTLLTVKPNENTKYRIGSITKMFTSVMILQLAEEKKLSLDTKLSKYFPRVKNASKITIENMLCHQSGIHNFTSDSIYLTYYTSHHSQKQMLGIIQALSPDFEPGTKQEYSNSNFVLLGFIIEKITKKTYAVNLQERIVNRIGLKNTYYGTQADQGKNESRSFKWINNQWKADKETDMSIPHGAGAIVSTTDDLVQFAHALFSGKLINQSSLENMTRLRNELGLGIFSSGFKGRQGFGHNGGIDEFGSQLKYIPEDSISVAITCNGSRHSMGACMKGILSCYYNEVFEIPTFVTHHVPEEMLKSYAGVYHSGLIKMDLTIVSEGTSLIAQPEGQESRVLEAVNDNTFNLWEAGAVFEFKKNSDGDVNEVILTQGGSSYVFIRKK